MKFREGEHTYIHGKNKDIAFTDEFKELVENNPNIFKYFSELLDDLNARLGSCLADYGIITRYDD
jgi:hypothetical protein